MNNRIRYVFMYGLYSIKEAMRWVWTRAKIYYNMIFHKKEMQQQYDNIIEVYKYLKQQEKKTDKS